MDTPTPDPDLTLASCPTGQACRVAEIAEEGLRRRLEQLGLAPGKIVVKVGGQLFNGPVVVRIGSTELALGRGMAQRVRVERLSSGKP